MKISEYLFREYKALTNSYLAASQKLRELLPRFVKMREDERVPPSMKCKELIRDLDKVENDIEETLSKLRNIRRRLLELV